QEQKDHVFRRNAKNQRVVAQERRDGDDGNRKADAGDRRAQRQVHAVLKLVGQGRAHRGDAFGQKHQRRDHDAKEALRQARRQDQRLDRLGDRLGQEDDGGERQEEKRERQERDGAR